jgi:hypothetical protein
MSGLAPQWFYLSVVLLLLTGCVQSGPDGVCDCVFIGAAAVCDYPQCAHMFIHCPDYLP